MIFGGLEINLSLGVLYFGSLVRGMGPVYGVSSDLGTPLTPANVTVGGGFSIVHPKVELVGQPTYSGFTVTRAK